MYTYHAPSNTVVSDGQSFPVEGKHEWKDGRELEEGKDYELRAVSVDIYAKPGTKMVGHFNREGRIMNGHDYQKLHAEKYIRPGVVYHLQSADVGNWATDFYLKEFPLVAFNSVHFVYPEPVAFPLAVQGEDELWKEFLAKVASINSRFGSNNVKFGFKKASEILLRESEDLKSQYTITKKK